MRISFLGKGGSGKTTMSTGFAKYMQNKIKNVVVVDADINAHLGKSMKMETIELGDRIEELGRYFEGERKVKGPLVVIGTTPPDYSSRFIAPDFNDDFFKKFAVVKDNLALVTVGTYTQEGVGADCYHSKLGSSEIIYNRLLDDDNMMVVTDQTAGIDGVGTTMFFVSDINVFVVEPTEKSIGVFKDFERVTKGYGIKNYAIVNKIMDEEDKEYVEKELGKEKVIAYIPYSKKLKRAEQGKSEEGEEFFKEVEGEFEKIYQKVKENKKDWNEYFKKVVNAYGKNIESWYNDYYGLDLSEYINWDFDYNKVIEELKNK